MAEPLGLSAARQDLDAAAARLRRLKRSLAAPAGEGPRLERWRALRRAVEGLRDAFDHWSPEAGGPALGEGADAEESSFAAEAALAELDDRQRALDDRRERALAALERAAEDRAHLRREAGAPGEPDARATAALLERLERLRAACERAFDEERRAQQAAAEAGRVWRGIAASAAPRLGARLEELDGSLTSATIKRLVERLDERWRASQRDWAETLGAPGAADAMAAAAAARERADLEREALKAEGERLKDSAARLEAELRGLLSQAESGRARAQAESENWKSLSEASRADLDRLISQLTEEELRREEQEKAASHAAAEASAREAALRAELAAAREELAAVSRAAVPAPPAVMFDAPAPAEPLIMALPEIPALAPSPAAPVEPELPSPPAAPAAELAWDAALSRLREPLEAAARQLKRLREQAGDERALASARLAEGAVAQADEIARALGAFVEASDGPGRMDEAFAAALAAWAPALERCGIRVTQRVARGLPAVGVSTRLLELAAHELIRNALDAMPGGGDLFVEAAVENGRIAASVADTGTTLPSDHRRLFQPLASAKPGRLGLGLPLVLKTAKRAGGVLEISQTIARGAVFTLRLPPAA